MLRYLPLLLLLSFEAKANWLCRVAASERNGEFINACGVSESVFEDQARDNALRAAQRELESICNTSPDCNNYEVIIKPLRTDCEKQKDGIYKCYRGIEAEITRREREDKSPRKFTTGIVVPVKSMVVQDELKAGIRRSVIEFRSIPEGADVSVDGVELCQTPCSRELQHGKHSVAFQKKDFHPTQEEVLIDESSSEIVRTLSDKFGSVYLKNVPKGSIVRVDDLVNDSTVIRMLPGEHIITIEGKYHQPFMRKVVIEKGKTQEINFDGAALYGFVEISATDKAGNAIKGLITVDGVAQKESTPATLKIDAGDRVIMVSGKNLANAEKVLVEPNGKLNLKFVLKENFKADTARPAVASKQCMSNADCPKGRVCATVRGEYPGNCAEEGRTIFTRIFETSNSESSGCHSDAECPLGHTCAPVRGEFPGSCAQKGGAFLDRIFGN